MLNFDTNRVTAKLPITLGVGMAVCLSALLMSCGGGGGGSDGSLSTLNFYVAPLGTQSLSVNDVNEIVSRAVQASKDRNVEATIAVTDRVGNVLAVYQTTNAAPNTTITSGLAGANGQGLDGTVVPSTLAAISKAITGAYLSSTGNAFSSRTASQIVQEHFQPGEANKESGPLYGVQFSQLPCSDLNVWFSQSPTLGPKRAPLGLSADPGGFPIYKNGRVVGGIGVITSANAATNGVYSLDRDIQTVETDLDEEVAFAALSDTFRAPEQIRADRITAGGQTFQFSNSIPAVAGMANLATAGAYTTVTGYTSTANPIAGTAYGASPSGYVATVNPAFAGLDTFNLITNPADNTAVRYPTKASFDGKLTLSEVQNILVEGMKTANRASGQIRVPLGSVAQVTVSVVDTSGDILGLVRSADAPIFGTDVSVQKARTALAFSSASSASDLRNMNSGGGSSFIDAMNSFFDGRATVLDGTVAFSARAIGNLHRPFYPDGPQSGVTGPLSTNYSAWSPFNVGYQLSSESPRILGVLTATSRPAGTFPATAGTTCADPNTATIPASRAQIYANGIQIFPGGFPIYKNVGGTLTLVGAVGISGDGVDQDDMVGFLSVINAGSKTGSSILPYPTSGAIRADQLTKTASGNTLPAPRYVQCPFKPFIDSDEQNPCTLP